MSKEAITRALQLRFGMPPERAVELSKFNEEQTDWFAFCKVCGAELHGSLDYMRKHANGHQT